MKKTRLVTTALLLCAGLAALLSSGCGEDFAGEEMFLGDGVKTRPLGVVCWPAEAWPGETIHVSVLFHEPHPEGMETTWHLALDYDQGLYETDEVERRIWTPPEGHLQALTVDEFGFVEWEFQFELPDSVILWSSALPDEFSDDDPIGYVARRLLGVTEATVSKVEIDAYLRDLPYPGYYNEPDPAVKALKTTLMDLFACQVRYRIRVESNIELEITKNQTIRYSGRFHTENMNRHPQLTEAIVLAVHAEIDDESDIPLHEYDRIGFWDWTGSGFGAEIPYHEDWTYFIRTRFVGERYFGPVTGDGPFTENRWTRWYHHRMDDPTDTHALFTREDGEEAVMFDLDDVVRLDPPGFPASYRVIVSTGDLRPEWRMYHFAPATYVLALQLFFVHPDSVAVPPDATVPTPAP